MFAVYLLYFAMFCYVLLCFCYAFIGFFSTPNLHPSPPAQAGACQNLKKHKPQKNKENQIKHNKTTYKNNFCLY